jgi:hypothetical protein
LVFREEVAVGDVGIPGARADFGAKGITDALDLAFVLTPDSFGVGGAAEFPGGVVAVFLEGMELGGEAAEGGDHVAVFLGVGSELLLGFRPEQEFGDFGGGDLEADFG